MPNGSVKWFNIQKGYGYIQPNDGSKDIFLHISGVQQTGLRILAEGQKIGYDLHSRSEGKNHCGQPANRLQTGAYGGRAAAKVAARGNPLDADE